MLSYTVVCMQCHVNQASIYYKQRIPLLTSRNTDVLCVNSTSNADVSVTIAGSDCVISGSVTDTQIECVTEPHQGSVEAQVAVAIQSTGIAFQESAAYEYIDVWSSPYTWGGESPPAAGDLVVIPSNMTVLLDTDTEIMKLLLIDGQ